MNKNEKPFTEAEEAVMNLLVEAHNQYVNLPVVHPSDVIKWNDTIHTLQYLLSKRVLRRDYPDYFY